VIDCGEAHEYDLFEFEKVIEAEYVPALIV
jgi:hypothetical protein